MHARCAFALALASAIALACSDEPPAAQAAKPAARPTAGCSKAGAPKGFLVAQKISVRSEERSYELFIPEGDGKTPLPTVFVFHGSGGSGADSRNTYALEGEAKGKAIFVYPNGHSKDWNIDDRAESNADIALFDAVLEQVSTSYCVDRSRVFATGFSRGGYFANHLGCRRGSVLRAVASHAGGGPFGASTEYDEKGALRCPEAPVAAIVVHGVDDTEVKLDEAKKSRDHWHRVNGCLSGTSPFGPAPCASLARCATERPVVYCEVPGLGHALWPGEGARVTWQFFDQF